MGQVMALDMMDDMYPTAAAIIRVTIKQHKEMMQVLASRWLRSPANSLTLSHLQRDLQ